MIFEMGEIFWLHSVYIILCRYFQCSVPLERLSKLRGKPKNRLFKINLWYTFFIRNSTFYPKTLILDFLSEKMYIVLYTFTKK